MMLREQREVKMDPFQERSVFLDNLDRLFGKIHRRGEEDREDRTEMTCPACGKKYPRRTLAESFFVCPACGHHFRLPARTRIRMTLDPRSFREFAGSIRADDPLDFPGYAEQIRRAEKRSRMREAVVTGTGRIGGHRIAVAAMDSRFMMGSMGTAVGEKIARTAEYATKKQLPLVIFSASGGARMQEGILSLMQMAKTAAAIGRHGDAGLLYISVLTDPTTGGVTASFASLGDIILAEPGALIGFAGPRVIRQTIRQELPEGFQRAAFQEEHGFADQVVPRQEMRQLLEDLLELHEKKGNKR